MILYTIALVIQYWENNYGGIGLFGSLITFPFSIFWGILVNAFSSIPAFIDWSVWLVAIYGLLSYSDQI